MPADLKKIHDHPAVLLDRLADSIPEGDDQAITHNAAGLLRAHEREHAVTFVALDNEGLAAVREAYAALSKPYPMTAEGARAEFLSAVTDLLGLDD